MASVEKYTCGAVYGQIAHDLRKKDEYTNPDIDITKSNQNYDLIGRENAWDYYKERLSQIFVFGRHNVVHAASWVISAPYDLNKDEQKDFFRACTDFLNERYGEKNALCAAVHNDEANQTSGHMHYLFMPICPDNNRHHAQNEKLCANDILNRIDLMTFHGDLQQYLVEHRVKGRVITGAVRDGQAGVNFTVEEIKRGERERYLLERNIELTQQLYDRGRFSVNQQHERGRFDY